jgi:hypothetical protein
MTFLVPAWYTFAHYYKPFAVQTRYCYPLCYKIYYLVPCDPKSKTGTGWRVWKQHDRKSNDKDFVTITVTKEVLVRGDPGKSLARPGKKQGTATKLGIYPTCSPRSSIHFLAHWSNFCKPLKKKIQNVVRPTRSPRQQWPPRRTKNGKLSMVFLTWQRLIIR